MRKLCVSMMLCLAVVGCEAIYEDDGSGPDNDPPGLSGRHTGPDSLRVVMCGDSRLHMGGNWDLLPYDVWNVSLSGTSCVGGMKRIYMIDQIKPDVVILLYGANDQVMGHPEDSTRDLITSLVNYHRGCGRMVVLLANPFIDTGYLKGLNNWMKARFPAEYLELLTVPADTYDGCHFTPAAYISVSAQIEAAIEARR
jgi:hypothetical protein